MPYLQLCPTYRTQYSNFNYLVSIYSLTPYVWIAQNRFTWLKFVWRRTVLFDIVTLKSYGQKFLLALHVPQLCLFESCFLKLQCQIVYPLSYFTWHTVYISHFLRVNICLKYIRRKILTLLLMVDMHTYIHLTQPVASQKVISEGHKHMIRHTKKHLKFSVRKIKPLLYKACMKTLQEFLGFSILTPTLFGRCCPHNLDSAIYLFVSL